VLTKMSLAFIDCCMSIRSYFTWPKKGFEVLIWLVIVTWVIFGLSITWRISIWESDMTQSRLRLEQHIERLQQLIKDNGIGLPFD